jgi:transcriptional regulator with XRE-family HTH domain
MLTSRQVLAGRALLDWTQQLLAEKAGATLTMLKRLESDAGRDWRSHVGRPP